MSINSLQENLNLSYTKIAIRKTLLVKIRKSIFFQIFTNKIIMKFIISFFLASVMWVQVPQWEADWSKCAVDVPDTSCHWYVAAPDNTFGEGFDWESAPWFDANGLQDVAKIEKESVVEKLQKN